jgi:hypothetical protein
MTLPKTDPLAGSKEVLISEKPFQVRAEARTVIEEAVHSGKSIYDVFRLLAGNGGVPPAEAGRLGRNQIPEKVY